MYAPERLPETFIDMAAFDPTRMARFANEQLALISEPHRRRLLINFRDHALAEAMGDARNPFFPGKVAHGYLILSFAAGLFVDPDEGPVLANTGLENLRFLKPVQAGAHIEVQLTVKRKTRRTDTYGEVRWHVQVRDETEEMVAEYELLTMVAY